MTLRGGPGGFEVAYADEDRMRLRRPLAACRTARFERLPPARAVRPCPGQGSVTRDCRAATAGGPLSCEPHLERHHAMLLDFGPRVTGLAARPSRLSWPGRRGRRGHVRDFFARLDDGGGLVAGVRPGERIEPDGAGAFAAAARACELAGWPFRRVGAIDPVLLASVKRLAGYRHPRCQQDLAAERLKAVFAEPALLFAGAERAGDRLAVLPVLCHLLRRRVLETTLASGMPGPRRVVRRAAVVR